MPKQRRRMGFNDVARALGEDGKTLKLWAGARERDSAPSVRRQAGPVRSLRSNWKRHTHGYIGGAVADR